MKKMKQQQTGQRYAFLSMAVALLMAFAFYLVIYYVQFLAHGTEILWTYRIVKGIIVSLMCALAFVLARRFGVCALQKYATLVLLVGTGMMVAFAALLIKVACQKNTILKTMDFERIN